MIHLSGSVFLADQVVPGACLCAATAWALALLHTALAVRALAPDTMVGAQGGAPTVLA